MKALGPLLAALFSAPAAQALLFWNLDNSANQSDPGTGVPWEAVGRVTNNSTSAGSGSAIYLGSGYVLTASHVTFDATYKYVTFNGSETYEVDTSFKDTGRFAGKQIATNVDLAVVKLLSSPSTAPVTLLTGPSELFSSSATIVGWGRGRDPSVPLSSTTVAWGNATTEAKRWGVNEPKTTANVPFGSGNFTALVTILGGNGPGFLPDGLGDAEAAVTLNDSGAGLFQNISGTWYLIGVATDVEEFGNSTFGNDWTISPRGQYNFYARISEYDHLITALIPEPASSTLALLALAAIGLGTRNRQRRS